MSTATETEGSLDVNMEVPMIGVGDDNEQIVQSVNQEEATSQNGSTETETVTQITSHEADTNTSKQEQMEKERKKLKRKLTVEFAACVILFGLSELFCIKFLPIDSLGYLCSMITVIHGYFTLVSGLFLLILTLFVHKPEINTNSHLDRVHSLHCNISKAVILISSTSLFLASLSPLYLLRKPYNFLIPIVLVPLFLSLGTYLYLRLPRTSHKKIEIDHTEYEEYLTAITRVSELSQATLSLSSGGLVGLLFGVYKNASNHAHHPLVRITIFLMFLCFVFSILLMLLCQMRVTHLSSKARENFRRVAAAFCMFLLLLLVIAAFLVSFIFLKWYTVVIFIPVLVVYGISFHIDGLADHHHSRENLPESEVKLAYTNANKVASLSFGGVMAIYAGYLGTSDHDERKLHLNLSMIFLTSAFISGLSLMLSLSYNTPTRSRIRLVISLLSCFGICLLLFGAFTTFIVEFVQL